MVGRKAVSEPARQAPVVSTRPSERATGRTPVPPPAEPLGVRLARARRMGRWPWLPVTLAVVLATLGMIGLGFWQYDRLVTRRAINTRIALQRAAPPVRLDPAAALRDPARFADRSVTVSGRWDYSREIVLRNRSYTDIPGFHIVTPLILDQSGDAILVDRGWIPYDRADPGRRAELPRPPTGSVAGIARLSQPTPPGAPPAATPAMSAVGTIDSWNRVDIAALQRTMSYRLLPLWVEELPRGGGLALPLPDPDLTLDDGPHLAYAIQWWAFAAILLAGYVILMTQPPSSRAKNDGN